MRSSLARIAVLVCLSGCAAAACAQSRLPTGKKVKPTTRAVRGTVVDRGGQPVGGAVVYLEDEKASTIRTYLADAGGHFHFGQLSLSTDYDLWSRKDKLSSKKKFISLFNSKPELNYKLKLKKAD